MSHRMQITLSDEQYQRLWMRSHASGSPISEIVRRAIDADDVDTGARERVLASITPSPLTLDEKLAAIGDSAGAWKDYGEEAYERWRRMRGHDLPDE